MKKKNITNDQLASMIKKGFDGVDEQFSGVNNRFDGVNNRFDKVEARLIKLEIRMDALEDEVAAIRKHQAMHTIFRDEFEKLDHRVKALEKLLIKHV